MGGWWRGRVMGSEGFCDGEVARWPLSPLRAESHGFRRVRHIRPARHDHRIEGKQLAKPLRHPSR